jgi:hypothetical protein
MGMMLQVENGLVIDGCFAKVGDVTGAILKYERRIASASRGAQGL